MKSRRSWLVCLVVFAGVVSACASQTDSAPAPETQTETTAGTQSTTSSAPSPATTGRASTTTVSPTTSQGVSTTEADDEVTVLVFYKTEGFTHESIAAGIEAFEELGSELGFDLTTTDDDGAFNTDELSSYDAVVFLNTTGDVLDPSQQDAMERFIGSGGGFMGIHSATDTEYEWPWYEGLIVTYFDGHPAVQPAVVEVVAPDHPIVAGITPQFQRTDEWYNFASLLGPDTTVLMTIDESSYEGGTMGEPHPITWAQEYQGGRAFYTGFGHTSESFGEPLVRRMLANAIWWVTGG